MSARDELIGYCLVNLPNEPAFEHAEVLADRYRAEILAEHPTAPAEAYPGELAALRGLARTLRTTIRPDNADIDEVRELLHLHATADAAARARVGAGHEQRVAQLLEAIRAHRGAWTVKRVQEWRRFTGGPTQRGTARRDLDELYRRGHLHRHGPDDGRFYTLNPRKDHTP